MINIACKNQKGNFLNHGSPLGAFSLLQNNRIYDRMICTSLSLINFLYCSMILVIVAFT